ncbi:MAG: ABC transporter, partial [Phototrophicaceae bacterium]
MNNKPLSHHLALLWKHRVLGWLWFKANIQMRYSQTFLGILWIIVLPLAQAAIMAFVFGNILQVRT